MLRRFKRLKIILHLTMSKNTKRLNKIGRIETTSEW